MPQRPLSSFRDLTTDTSQAMEGARKWEDLGTDCLVSIFQRLGLEDLAATVPFVCSSWSRAALDPLCWRILDFQPLDFMPWSKFAKKFAAHYSLSGFNLAAFMKFAVARSQGLATELRFPPLFGASVDDLAYASNECPRLREVVLPNLRWEDEERLPELVGKWRELERLEMATKPSSFPELAAQISLKCNKFGELAMSGSIKKEDASAIVDHLPKIRSLDVSKSFLPREELLVIVKGCKEIERLNVSDCVGFEAEDDEILKRASRIKIFQHEGARLRDELGYETDECDESYVLVI